MSSKGAYSQIIIQTCWTFFIVEPNVFHILVIIPSVGIDLLQILETTLDLFSSIVGNEDWFLLLCHLKIVKNNKHFTEIKVDPRVYLVELDAHIKNIVCLCRII